jgi:hypothetical protein
MASQTFHLGDILSITTGYLVSLNRMDGVYRIIDYMTGVPHFTHQLPRASVPCAEHLLTQYPWLADVAPPAEFAGQNHVNSWLAEQVTKYGEYHEVATIQAEEYVPHESLAELQRMMNLDTK